MGNLSSNVVQIDLLSGVRMGLSFFIPSIILMLFSQAPLRCLSCYTCPYLQLHLEILLPSLFGRFWGVLPKKFSVPHLICRALCSPSNSDFLVHTSPRPLKPTFASMFTPTVLIVCIACILPSWLVVCTSLLGSHSGTATNHFKRDFIIPPKPPCGQIPFECAMCIFPYPQRAWTHIWAREKFRRILKAIAAQSNNLTNADISERFIKKEEKTNVSFGFAPTYVQ